MNLALRLVRANLLPALAFAGLAIFAWGVVDWWTFHRALFVEEVAAIEALAGKKWAVEYVRQGETTPHRFEGKKPESREAIPWSLPFVGRIEQIDAEFDDYDRQAPSDEVRERTLRLPGLRRYSEASSFDSGGYSPPRTPAAAVLAGRRLPTLPEGALTDEDLAEELPDGESLPEADVRELAKRIESAWRKEPSDRPRLEYQVTKYLSYSRDDDWQLVLRDGEREWEGTSSCVLSPFRSRYGHVLFRTAEGTYSFTESGNAWRMNAFGDQDLVERLKPRPPYDQPRQVPSDPHEMIRHYIWDRPAEILGPDGAGVARMVRIDERRYRIDLKPWTDPKNQNRRARLHVIVRSDLDWGIERFEAYNWYGGAPHDSLNVGVARLERVGDVVVMQESLCAQNTASPSNGERLTRPRRGEYRTLVATEFDPIYPESLFDPRRYEARLPLRGELPVDRPHRYLLAAGGACLLLATCGWLIVAASRRSVRRGSGDRKAGRGFSPQFGLATLLAIALLVISGAGWIKRHLDDAREQLAILAALAEEGTRVRAERRAPGLAFLLVSTDALPLDAPLVRVSCDVPPPPEALERLFAHSAEVEYVCDAPPHYSWGVERTTPPPSLDRHIAALGGKVPEAADIDRAADPPLPFPRGRRSQDAASASLIDRAIEAWQKAGAEQPDAYLVREEIAGHHLADARLTIRDGSRFRSAQSDDGVDRMECRDDRHRRLFAWIDDEWRLTLRQPLSIDDHRPPAAAVPSVSDDLAALATGDVSYGGWTSPYERPVKEGGLPRAPYCLPPCLASWAPPLDDALHRLTAKEVVAVETIDLNRVRFDLLYPFPASDDTFGSPYLEATEERPWIVGWSIVARIDLDWAVESCEFVEEFVRTVPGADDPRGGVAPDRTSRRRREVRIVNTIDPGEGDPAYAGAAFVCTESEGDAVRKQIAGTCRYAVDLSPEFPDAVFDRATVDSPDPPLPETQASVRWYGVTAALGCLALVVLGARRMSASRKKSRETTA